MFLISSDDELILTRQTVKPFFLAGGFLLSLYRMLHVTEAVSIMFHVTL